MVLACPHASPVPPSFSCAAIAAVADDARPIWSARRSLRVPIVWWAQAAIGGLVMGVCSRDWSVGSGAALARDAAIAEAAAARPWLLLTPLVEVEEEESATQPLLPAADYSAASALIPWPDLLKWQCSSASVDLVISSECAGGGLASRLLGRLAREAVDSKGAIDWLRAAGTVAGSRGAGVSRVRPG